MEHIIIPKDYNYIAAFLTLYCNYRCGYCINSFGELRIRGRHLTGEDWVRGLNRIVSCESLPVTLQGGEPSLHGDFFYIINNLKPELDIDILTNLHFDVDEFIDKVNPQRLKRHASYASIRVSYHPQAMDFEETLKKALKMFKAGFSVGIWGMLHPAYKYAILEAQDKSRALGIDFRVKEFLGEYNGKLYGTYKYADACNKNSCREVACRTTELIISPAGEIYRCHSDLYEARAHIGNILDDNFIIRDEYRPCALFGRCNPCDVKIKTDRFQRYGHTSVDIKETAYSAKVTV